MVITKTEASNLFADFPPSSHLLLAVSGGADSVAMMALASLAGRFILSAATVNHGLRPEALDEARHVASLSECFNIPHAILEWQGEKPQTRLQERARNARYDLLLAHARFVGASHILTAHTLDDQAETILFRMARGSGITGLIGMRAHVQHGDITHSRPLLSLPKERLVDTCKAYNLVFIDDKSNTDTQFARVRMRKILPILAKEGLTAKRFAVLSNRSGRIDQALEARVDQIWTIACLGPNFYDLRTLSVEPDEILLRFLLRVLRQSHVTANTASLYFTEHLRLKSVEAVLNEFRTALNCDKNWRKSLCGLVLSLDRHKHFRTRIDPRLQ